MAEGQMRAEKRTGREGNRWINTRPTGEEVAKWFGDNVPIYTGEGEAEGLKHDDYVGGVTLIPNKEKTEELVGWDTTNAPVLQTFYDLAYTPYMRVETRIKYFHDLCDLRGWLAVIEPVEIDRSAAKGLPPGFFRHRVAIGPETGANFLGSTMRVIAYDRDGLEEVKLIIDKRTGEEKIVRRGTVMIEGVATKTVPTVLSGRNNDTYADVNALMKVETGAVGRALGMAGILVIPGTGIATAEDLQESNRLTSDEPAAEPALPSNIPAETATPTAPVGEVEPVAAAESQANDDALRDRAAELINEMKAADPATFEEFKTWAGSRGFIPLSAVVSPGLRGLHRRAEKMLEDARQAKVDREAVPAPAAPKPAAEPTDPLED